MEQIMKPHTPYYKTLKHIFGCDGIHGIAHITGGGIEGNLSRIIPDNLCAEIDLSKINTLPIFSYIQKIGNIEEKEMLATFNCGVGLNIVVAKKHAEYVKDIITPSFACYEIGKIKKGREKVIFTNHISW